MNLMICLRGEPDELGFLPEIAELGAGIELQSYGMFGIQSALDWETRFRLHQALRAQFAGTVAVHGPFMGMDYTHIDFLIREAVLRRLGMTFDVAVKLQASRVILHGGYGGEIDLFGLQDDWVKRSVEFWLREIRRWANAGIVVVLENDIQRTPDALVRVVSEVDHPSLGLCLDVGHEHVFSRLGAMEWLRRMGARLYHVHLHDNDGIADSHSAIGRGTIDIGPFYNAIAQHVPQATLALEVEDCVAVRMSELRRLAARFGAQRNENKIWR